MFLGRFLKLKTTLWKTLNHIEFDYTNNLLFFICMRYHPIFGCMPEIPINFIKL
jgi:hypothetical protein